LLIGVYKNDALKCLLAVGAIHLATRSIQTLCQSHFFQLKTSYLTQIRVFLNFLHFTDTQKINMRIFGAHFSDDFVRIMMTTGINVHFYCAKRGLLKNVKSIT